MVPIAVPETSAERVTLSGDMPVVGVAVKDTERVCKITGGGGGGGGGE